MTSLSASDNRGYLFAISRFFNEATMGLLALVALATALGPMVFDVGPTVERWLTVVEWVLVGAFAAEFLVQAAVVPDRAEWLRSPWRIVDVATIVGPLLALLPQVSDVASGSLMLRALRIGRAVAFGTRAGSAVVRQPRRFSRAARVSAPVVRVISESEPGSPTLSDWTAFMKRASQPVGGWAHASSLDGERFKEFARSAGMSDRDIERMLVHDAHARLRAFESHTTLLLQIATVPDAGFPEVQRDWLLVVAPDKGVLSASTGSFDVHQALLQESAAIETMPFHARAVVSVLSYINDRNLVAAQRFEDEARRLEALEGGAAFLRESFRLRREISSAALDLWHVTNLVRGLANGRTKLGSVSLRDEKAVDELLAETESLHATMSGTRDELQTLIELHINFKSFEMNNFLKLLAVVSFLGLIPSVIGGLLGMNVMDNPWPVTLGQVAFGVMMGMATALYVFAVKGWLR